jgi:probable phosphoglycerate mutase
MGPDQKATTIIAIRHGETEWNRLGLQQGHLDSPLTPLGREQASAMAEALAEMGIQTIYSSDLGRARETADLVAGRLGLPVSTDPRLRERDLGILEGLTMAQFGQNHPAEAAALWSGDPDYVLPGGESTRQRHTRNIASVEDLARQHPGGVILIVAHGGVLNSFFRKAVGLPLEVPRRFSLDNAALNVFTIAGSVWRLQTWGSISHLGSIPTMDDH